MGATDTPARQIRIKQFDDRIEFWLRPASNETATAADRDWWQAVPAILLDVAFLGRPACLVELRQSGRIPRPTLPELATELGVPLHRLRREYVVCLERCSQLALDVLIASEYDIGLVWITGPYPPDRLAGVFEAWRSGAVPSGVEMMYAENDAKTIVWRSPSVPLESIIDRLRLALAGHSTAIVVPSA